MYFVEWMPLFTSILSKAAESFQSWGKSIGPTSHLFAQTESWGQFLSCSSTHTLLSEFIGRSQIGSHDPFREFKLAVRLICGILLSFMKLLAFLMQHPMYPQLCWIESIVVVLYVILFLWKGTPSMSFRMDFFSGITLPRWGTKGMLTMTLSWAGRTEFVAAPFACLQDAVVLLVLSEVYCEQKHEPSTKQKRHGWCQWKITWFCI